VLLDNYARCARITREQPRFTLHPERLREIRARLARNRGTCPLFATDRFRRHLESAYIVLRERSQRGETPTPFSVVPLRDAKASPVDTQSIG